MCFARFVANVHCVNTAHTATIWNCAKTATIARTVKIVQIVFVATTVKTVPIAIFVLGKKINKNYKAISEKKRCRMYK